MPKPVVAFEIPALPRMTNNSGRTNNHWSDRAKEAKQWQTAVMAMVGSQRPPSPLSLARLVLTRFSSVPPDPDGLVSGFKHIIDGLVHARVLKDDKWTNIGMPEYRWEKAPAKKGKVRVEVWLP